MPELTEAGAGSGGRERHEPEGSRWITVHPMGADSKGQPVLISGSGMVLGGMGGKFNGQHIADVHKGSQGTAGNAHTQAVHPEHNPHMATWQGMQSIADVTVHGTPEKHASGAHSVHITGGKDLEATLNKHGQGTTESGAFLERHPSGGVIYHGTAEMPHDYPAFAHHMAQDVMGHVMGAEHTKETAKPGKSAYKEETAAEGRAYRQQVMKGVRDFIRGEGGIKAHSVATEGQAKRGLSARQGDEYNRVPSWAKNAAGKHTMDTMAPIVGAQFPHLGIETEDDLREYLVQHEATRKADADADEADKTARGHARAARQETAPATPEKPAEAPAEHPGVTLERERITRRYQSSIEVAQKTLAQATPGSMAHGQAKKDLARLNAELKHLSAPDTTPRDEAGRRLTTTQAQARDRGETPPEADHPPIEPMASSMPVAQAIAKHDADILSEHPDLAAHLAAGAPGSEEKNRAIKLWRDNETLKRLTPAQRLEGGYKEPGEVAKPPIPAPSVTAPPERPTWDTAPRGEEGDYAGGHLRFNRSSWQTFAVDHPASIAEYNRLHGEGKVAEAYDPRIHHVIHPLTGSAGAHPVGTPTLATKAAVAAQSKYIKRGAHSPEQQAAIEHLNAQKVKKPAADSVALFPDAVVKDRPKEPEPKRREPALFEASKGVAMDVQEDADLTVTDSEGEESDPMDVADAELTKTEPDVLTPKRRHTRARDGTYNGAETVLERGTRTGVRMTESVALDEARTDRARREVLLRIISPGFGSSRDPKSGLPVYYTEAALQEAAPLFAGKKCFLNHATPAERKARPEGDITRWGATIKESWWDPSHKAPVGRTRVVNSNLWEAIELDPEEVACSIRAHGTGRVGMAEGQQAWLCEHIDTVHSVDFVTYAGARGGVIEILESDRAAVRFTAEEERKAQRDMFEDITETDLRESRPDLVEAILRTQKPPALDLTEALRPYQERVQRAEEAQAELERKLNNRDARSLVDQALAACGLPRAATERVRVQFAESTYGFDGASHGSDAELVEAVGKAATAEGDYIKSVTAPEGKRTITGMGAAAPTVPQPATPRQPDRTVLQEAASRMDILLTTRPARGAGPASQEPAGVPLQSRMDALVGSGAKG